MQNFEKRLYTHQIMKKAYNAVKIVSLARVSMAKKGLKLAIELLSNLPVFIPLIRRRKIEYISNIFIIFGIKKILSSSLNYSLREVLKPLLKNMDSLFENKFDFFALGDTKQTATRFATFFPDINIKSYDYSKLLLTWKYPYENRFFFFFNKNGYYLFHVGKEEDSIIFQSYKLLVKGVGWRVFIIKEIYSGYDTLNILENIEHNINNLAEDYYIDSPDTIKENMNEISLEFIFFFCYYESLHHEQMERLQNADNAVKNITKMEEETRLNMCKERQDKITSELNSIVSSLEIGHNQIN